MSVPVLSDMGPLLKTERVRSKQKATEKEPWTKRPSGPPRGEKKGHTREDQKLCWGDAHKLKRKFLQEMQNSHPHSPALQRPNLKPI